MPHMEQSASLKTAAPLSGAGELVSAYGDMVYRLAYIRTRSRADAEDVAQEVFLRYFRKNPVFQTAEHQKAWLIRVTVNCTKNLLTSAWNRYTVPRDDTLPEPPCSEKEADTSVTDAVMQLGKRDRTVVHLYYYEDYSLAEIAAATGDTESAVKSRLFHARQKLRELLKGEYDDV